jgi:hypothetical protein
MIPKKAIDEAASALIEVCASFSDVELEVLGEARPFEPNGQVLGSCVSLTQPEGSFSLAVLGNEASCEFVTRALFAMEPDEEVGKDEHADALGEIANMTAGTVKRALLTINGEEMLLGLPLFFSGSDGLQYVRKGVDVITQEVGGDGIELQVVLICQRGQNIEVKAA